MNTKQCSRCSAVKPLNDFYKNRNTKDKLYTYCKACFDKQNNARRDAIKERAILYKGGKCVRCLISYPETPSCVFDFHHRDPSTKEDWKGIRKWGWERVRNEIEKCDLVCSNCHRTIHGASDRT